MNQTFNNSDEADSFDDDDAIAGSMILQGLIKKPSLKTSTARSTGKPEVTLALSIVLVILIILLIISIFLLLYCVLKRQGERAERRKRGDYERRRQQEIQSKTVLTDSVRKAKVSRIAASIEAAVKSAETTLKSPEATKQMPSQSTQSLPDIQSKPKLITQKLPSTKSYAQAETAVEAPSLSTNQIFVHRSRGPWQQVGHEPSDFSYELESDSVNDDICLQPL